MTSQPSTTAELVVENYSCEPEVVDKLTFQVHKVQEAGLSGTLKDIRWDHDRQTMAATLIHDGYEIEIVSSETEFTSCNAREEHIDPHHWGESQSGSPVCIRRIGPGIVARAVAYTVLSSRRCDAWAAGKVRSTEQVKFDLPLSWEEVDAPTTWMAVEGPDVVLDVTLTTDDALQVAGVDGSLGEAEAGEALDVLLAGMGNTRADLVDSMKACRAVDERFQQEMESRRS